MEARGGCPLLAHLFNIVLKSLTNGIKGKEVKYIVLTVRRRLPFAGIIIICAKFYKLLEEIMEFSKVTGKYVNYIVCL